MYASLTIQLDKRGGGRSVWEPGQMTSAQMQDEWFEVHGWAATPPTDVVAQWRATAAAETAHSANDGVVAPPAPADVSTEIGVGLPDALVVPAHPHVDGSAGFGVELIEIDGTQVVVGYTSVDKLVAQLGSSQPWVAMTASDIAATHATRPIVVDPAPGIVHVNWSDERLAALRKVLTDG
ncbi:hypothetical protein GCM10009619_05830 [Williamsia maris]